MNKNYLIVFSKEIDRDKLIKFLEDLNYITHWFYSIPNSIFIKSVISPQDMIERIENEFGKHRIFITEISNYYGRLPKEHWEYFN